jgi:hypothetical protein
MKEISSQIAIDAPIATVWKCLADLGHWKDWNPIVTEASGDLAIGSTLHITMCGIDDQKGHKYSPVVTMCKAPNKFHWKAKMMAGFLFTNGKIFELEETSSGTRLLHVETFSGLLVPLFWSKLNKGVKPMIQSMNTALKTLAEQGEVS